MRAILQYRVGDVDTCTPAPVTAEVQRLCRLYFPGVRPAYIRSLFLDVAAMFEGRYPPYQPMDTVYHDLDHTLQASLCWVRLIVNRQASEAGEPALDEDHFRMGLAAIAMHDTGYLKERDDPGGTGAKYTFVHEARSCDIADAYLRKRGWPAGDIYAVRHLISCTGPRADLDAVPFASPAEHLLGMAVRTADFVGQMSDPAYVHKLPALFNEFQEAWEYQQIPPEQRMFHSPEDLFAKTPSFWEFVRKKVLEGECQGLYHYLRVPYPDGVNAYVEAVERNIALVEDAIDRGGPSAIVGA